MDDLGTEAGKEALQAAGDMLRKIAGPLCDEIGESMGVVARHYRFKLATRMFRKTERMLAEAGLDPHSVPPRLFLPIVENASMQDDEDLHTRWAALLANAATLSEALHPSYIEVLRQLTPEDARLLDRLYDSCIAKQTRTVNPWVDTISYAERERRRAAGEDPEKSFENLTRLGLIATRYDFDGSAIQVEQSRNLRHIRAKAEEAFKSEDYLTDFAVGFVRACRAPVAIADAQMQLGEQSPL